MRYALPLYTRCTKIRTLSDCNGSQGLHRDEERTYYHIISTSWIDYMYLFLIGISVFMCIYFV